jgi:hypothetical protein
MTSAVAAVAVSAIVVASIAVAPAGGRAFGGSPGSAPGGGFQGFNPAGGFRGFNPAGFRGFNPAGGFRGFNPGDGGRPVGPPPPPKHGGVPPKHRFHRSFSPGYFVGAYGAPLYYAPPVAEAPSYDITVYAPTQVYIAPPVYVPVAAPAAVSAAAPAAAPSSVVEYPEGRYELRGDGVSVPYAWVWIPNPPAAPPAATPPAAAPGGGGRSPAPRSQLYRWVDPQGVLHVTNNADAVPERLRKRAESDDTR